MTPRALRAAAILAPVLTLALALGGCVIYSQEGGDRQVAVHVGDAAPAASAALEPVRAVRAEDGRLIVRVDSNGCTQAADFAVRIEESDPVRVRLERQKPDHCRALVPDGVEVSWTYEELGLTAGQAVRLFNPLRL